MNEKRFTIKPSRMIEGHYVINDKESKYAFNPCATNKKQLQSTINALNQLNDENEQLKYEIISLKNTINMLNGNKS